MVQKLKKIWKNRRKIFEGIWASLFPNAFIKLVSKYRFDICKMNACGYYDKLGVSEAVIVKGKPSCAQCGCSLAIKTKSLSSQCALSNIGRVPLWSAIMSGEDEDTFKKKHRIKD